MNDEDVKGQPDVGARLCISYLQLFVQIRQIPRTSENKTQTYRCTLDEYLNHIIDMQRIIKQFGDI